MFRALIRFIILIVEKIVSAFALVAAFVSTAETGNLLERILGSLETLYATFHGFGAAYARNEQFRTVWERFTAAFNEGLEAAAQNIEANPSLILYTFIATIVCYKLAAWVLKLMRKSMLRRRSRGGGNMRSKGRPANEERRPASATYDRLYEPPDVSPSTSAQLDKMHE